MKGKNFSTNLDGVTITLSFAKDDIRVHVKVVNIYGARHMIDGKKISFGSVISTMMSGFPAAMHAESKYFKLISREESYDIKKNILIIYSIDDSDIKFNAI